MTRINLLPWREELREEQKREYSYMLAGSAVFSILIVALVHMVMNQKIDYQNERNTLLRNEINVVDRRIAEIRTLKEVKSSLLARMTMIQGLQANRPQMVHLFDDMVTVLPKGVHLEQVQRKNNSLTVQGFAESNATISQLMRKIYLSPWMANPDLNVIKTRDDNGKRSSEFQLNIEVSKGQNEGDKP